jgi:hypothetical protein
VASKGAQAVITGNCGPNAVRTLSAAGVTLFVGQSGTVRQAVDDHKMGKLLSTTEANVTDHFGMGGNASPSGEPMASGGSGFGMGRGMGRGGGTGRGGGMGRGMGCRRDVGAQGGMGRWPAPGSSVGAPLSKEEQIRHLRDEAAALRRQIEGLEASIEKLEQD